MNRTPRSGNQLPPAVNALMRRAFRERWTIQDIVQAVAKLGCTVSERTVSRRAREFRADQARQKAGSIDSVRLVHRSTDSLPPEARAIMERGFRERWAAKAIVAAVSKIGVTVAERTVCRRGREFRAEQARNWVVQQLGQNPPTSWRVDEVLELAAQIDLAPGWFDRYKRRLRDAIKAFFAAPSAERIRHIELLLISYVVAGNVGGCPSKNHVGQVLSFQRIRPVEQPNHAGDASNKHGGNGS